MCYNESNKIIFLEVTILKIYAKFVLLMAIMILSACTELDTNEETKQNEPKEIEVTTGDTNSDDSSSNGSTTKSNTPDLTKSTIERPNVSKMIKIENATSVDGDTIKGLVNGKQESIRILLVDTPETKHPSKPVQPFGPEASQFTKDFIEKNKDNLYLELDVEERDKYRRVLGYVWGEQDMLNALLVQTGLARVGYVYQSTRHLDPLKELQTAAQQSAVGIWSVENYATDSGFSDDSESKTTQPTEQSPVSQTPSSEGSTIVDANDDGQCNDVKGNEGSNGNIYHVPGGSSYEVTKAEQYFCTEQEAEAAGFRKSQR